MFLWDHVRINIAIVAENWHWLQSLAIGIQSPGVEILHPQWNPPSSYIHVTTYALIFNKKFFCPHVSSCTSISRSLVDLQYYPFCKNNKKLKFRIGIKRSRAKDGLFIHHQIKTRPHRSRAHDTKAPYQKKKNIKTGLARWAAGKVNL